MAFVLTAKDFESAIVHCFVGLTGGLAEFFALQLLAERRVLA